MTKEEMISRVSSETGLGINRTALVINVLLNDIAEVLADGESVRFRGFGTFDVVERAERVARNPITNEEIRVPAKQVPVFKPGNVLKTRVEEGLTNADN